MLWNKKRLIKSASSAPHCLLSRLQGHSFQFVFQLVFPAYTLQLPSICVLPTAFKTFCWNKLGIFTGTSWHFSNISSDISAPWAHERTSLDVNKANGMLTSNPKRIFCNNVTCFGSKNAAAIGVICNSASIAPHFLLARLQNYSFQLVIQLACAAYTLQLPSICVLLTAFKIFCWNKRGILPGTSWHFSNISSDISAPWAHESTSLDINIANGMLTSNAKRIFCNNVTCFGSNECCWDRSHLQGCLNCSSLLARVRLSTCCPISLSRSFPHTPYSLTASLYQCPADCFRDILLEQAGNSHWNKLAFIQNIK